MPTEGATVVTATFGVDRRACVIDARFALGRGGLLGVATLAHDTKFDIWLSGELREIVRNPTPFLERPELLLPEATQEETDALRSELLAWDRWMTNTETGASRLFCLGDRPDESTLPHGIELGLRDRFELLQRGLDRLICRSGHGSRVAPLGACFRDAMSLSAAMLPRRSIVLTRLDAREGRGPALCEQLSSWGLRVAPVPSRNSRATPSSSCAVPKLLVNSGLSSSSTRAWPSSSAVVRTPRCSMNLMRFSYWRAFSSALVI